MAYARGQFGREASGGFWERRPLMGWNHNVHYHDVVLNSIPPSCTRALDIGCGRGDLADLG
jgi:hypothetical protein